MIQSAHFAFFSPSSRTRRTLQNIASGMQGMSLTEKDLTLPTQRAVETVYDPESLVVIGMPVYFGRIPKVFHNGLPLRGNNTPAVYVVVYGNRDYEDALIELQRLGEQAGFVSIAAAACVAEHSLCPSIAANRPDSEDIAAQRAFGARVLERAVAFSENPEAIQKLTVKGNVPYREYGVLPVPEIDKDVCIECGLCARICPAGAIEKGTFEMKDKTACLSCGRCVKGCPAGAWALSEAAQKAAAEKMAQIAKMCTERKEPEFFWA